MRSDPWLWGRKTISCRKPRGSYHNRVYHHGTCKALGVNPYDYMMWFLTKAPSIKTSEIGKISPAEFKKSSEPAT